MQLSNCEKMRAADFAAINDYGIPSTLLMTNAASHLVSAALDILNENSSIVIFCGSGNNGGDGVAAAFMLKKLGYTVSAYLIGARDKMTADTLEMERRLIEYGGALIDFCAENFAFPENCGVIIDAMFGIGLNSPLRGKGLDATKLINAAKIPVISADIPSGVSADSGAVLGEAVKADITVTFSMAKPAHFVEPGCVYCGEVRVRDIGIPTALLGSAAIDAGVIQSDDMLLPKRSPLSHKYTYGRCLIIGGSVGYTGAVSLCSRAAVKSGAGVVFTGVPQSIYNIVAIKNDEAVVFPLAEDIDGRLSMNALAVLEDRLKTASSLVLGPGLARSEELTELVAQLVQRAECPTVLDADALFAISKNLDILRNASVPMILTPHEGEFRSLGGVLTGDRIADATSFAKEYNCTLVLKGHHTIAAFPSGKSIICPYGNAGMAKGGSGDVLAGIMGAFLGFLPLEDAVKSALYVHARSGDLCTEKYGEYSATPLDMINCIASTIKHISER